MTVWEIIQDAVSDGLGLERDPIQNNVINEGIAKYRKCGKTLFDLYPWDNTKVPVFDTDNATYVSSYTVATGIIVFESVVDTVRAVRSVDATDTDNDDTIVYPQSDINAAINGVEVSSGRFDPYPDDSSGHRRIIVSKADAIAKYKILAQIRFVPAVIDAAYDPLAPTTTPTDYRVLSWPIDHADSAIIAYIADELRVWDGQTAKGDWTGLFKVAKDKIERQQARGNEAYPADPMYGDMDEW